MTIRLGFQRVNNKIQICGRRVADNFLQFGRLWLRFDDVTCRGLVIPPPPFTPLSLANSAHYPWQKGNVPEFRYCLPSTLFSLVPAL